MRAVATQDCLSRAETPPHMLTVYIWVLALPLVDHVTYDLDEANLIYANDTTVCTR